MTFEAKLITNATLQRNESVSKMFSARSRVVLSGVASAVAFGGAVLISVVVVVWPERRAYGQAVFVEAAFQGHLNTMKLLLFLGADVNEFGCSSSYCLTPLVAAAYGGQYEATQLLLKHGADVNKRLRRGQTALMFASYFGHPDIVKLLLSKGADINLDWEGDTALCWARQKHHSEIVRLLQARGATGCGSNVDSSGK